MDTVVTDGVQSLLVFTLMAITVGVPLLIMSKLYRQPSPVYRKPWRATVLLVGLSVISPLGGYFLAGALSEAALASGWSLLYGRHGFVMVLSLALAAAFLFAANLAIVVTLIVRRATARDRIAPE
jgi:hypothetical protein